MKASKQAAAPCIDPTCGTRWGSFQRNRQRPWRGRGYCSRCYQRHYARGDFDENIGLLATGMGAYPTHTTPAYLLWHTPNGERQSRALPFRADYDRAAVEAEAEAFAARWLAEHPTHAAKWCPTVAEAA